ncbi:MAG: hypothetical protein AAF789_02905, partial [Bacteroidota bacterium]
MRYLPLIFFTFFSFFLEAQIDKDYILKSIYFPGGSYYIEDWQLIPIRSALDSLVYPEQYSCELKCYTAP